MSADSLNELAGGVRHWAEATPDTVAVFDALTSLTFDEFDARVGTLARLILEFRADAGVSDSMVLPIIVTRSMWSMVAIHAAIRSGVAFAALDASNPPQVIAQLLHRLDQPGLAIVADLSLAALLPAGVRVLDARTAIDDPVGPQPLRPDALAAVVFTSGSTGQAKGVMLDWTMLWALHRRFSDDIAAAAAAGSATTRAMCLAPFSFVAGLAASLTPSGGHSLSVVDPTVLDPLALLERIDSDQVSYLPIVSSLAATLLERWPKERRLQSVTRVRVFGEAFSWDQVAPLRQLLNPAAEILCGYAASEAPNGIFLNVITPETPIGVGRVHLGLPTAPDRVRFEPLSDEPDSVCQMVVRGLVALGYLGEPELTAARFGTDPDGTRWWRSGDIGEQLPDGAYRHAGRIDDLVKIRGKLVEPAEPEQALRRITGIRNVIVLPHGTRSGKQRLVAHLELDESSTLTAADVRSQLTSSLAPHLVPALLMTHAQLPRTERGKIDRVALQGGAVTPWRTGTQRPPNGPLEQFIVDSAAAALDLDPDQLGPDEDLWDFGLDSFSAIELAARLADEGWGDLDLNTLIGHRTPAALALLLRSTTPHKPSTVTHLNSTGTRPPVFLIPGEYGNALGFNVLIRELGADQPAIVIEANGVHTPGRVDRTVSRAARRVTDQIIRLQTDGRIDIVGYSAGGVVAYEAAHQLRARGREVQVVLLDAVLAGSNATLSASRPATSFQTKMAAHSRRQLLASILYRPRLYYRRAAVLYRYAVPGRPSTSVIRRRAIERINSRAGARYTPQPAAFPVVLFHVANSPQPQRWARVVPNLQSTEVGGGHATMLAPPHARHLAAQLAAVLAG
ncbi:unannotated protein [freshwater metagenome]|uniref:Unannotated protein n=1 Tax=freshwater metagenome TaxID=449393 RepID=A0A6J7EYS2_9ZZZZ|nr:alpha/beta fold hydrolase [Actinomycetota bacterium]